MVQKTYSPDGSKWDDEDIVISGISARLPNCDSVEEFQENLLAKVDLITDEPRRFQNGLYGAIKRYGLLKDLSKFDAKFFNIHPKQAERMDPQIRNLLEVAYEATIDAGLHPEDLKGTKTGVVVGVASSETQDKWSQMPDRINGYEYTGCTRTMFANRVSYYFDIKGPSYSIDTASSTTLVAFQQAYDMIRDGVCDACFVCGTDLVLNPCVCLMFQCLNMLSPEGKCKAFDISGDGYVRSEGAVAVLLQKAKNAKRVYANVLAAGSNCDGYKDEGITFPSGAMQVKLFSRVAEIAGIDPTSIDFMEAHGSATRVGDPQEMNAVTEVFTTGRKGPLRTGSIKSNMGHGEPASALSAVIKVCVAMECGIIPPNLHYHVPNPDIPALLDGRLQVITEPTPWDGGIVAVNSFGVGGANGHALLLSNKKSKQLVKDNIPRLVCVSGVTENAVHTMLNKIESLPRDTELYALLNNVHRKNIKGHDFRGYLILNGQTIKNIRKTSGEHKLCLVLPGVESTWKSVDVDMFNLTVLQNSLKNTERVLKTVIKNVNLISLLKTLGTEESPLNFVVGVVALQIGLIDILRSLEISFDYIIGFNIGEIAAGYADEVYSAQEAVLSAFHIGTTLQRFYYPSSIIKTNIPRNRSNQPSDVSLFAKISANCNLFSGPKPSIHKFVQKLKSKGYEAADVNYSALDCIGILRTSGHIPKLNNDLKNILTNTKQPNKWLTYSVQQLESYSCSEYLVRSLAEPALFQNAIKKMNEPIMFELSFVSGVYGFENNFPAAISLQGGINGLLNTIGELYNFRFQPQIQNLYPSVQFPVSHGTPMIQSMIEWDHSEKWNVVSFAPQNGRTAGEHDVVVDFNKAEFENLPGNMFCNHEVFPRAFYLKLLWRAMSRFQNKPISEIPLVIEHMFFIRETSISEDEFTKFTVNILESSGKFEIWESGSIVASGHVRIPQDLTKENIPSSLLHCGPFSSDGEMTKDDVYQTLSVRQYQYTSKFQQLQSFNFKSNVAKVKMEDWCSLIEAFLQISILNSTFTENSTPLVSFIRKITIDPRNYKTEEITSIQFNQKWNVLKSDVIEIRGIKVDTRPYLKTVEPTIESSNFVPFISQQVEHADEITLLLALQNWTGYNDLKIAELVNDASDILHSLKIKYVNPFVNTDVTVYSNDISFLIDSTKIGNVKLVCKDITVEAVDNNCHIVIGRNVLGNSAAFSNLISSVRIDGCILLEENYEEQFPNTENLECISRLSTADKTFMLLKKVHSKIRNAPRVITTSNILDCAQKLKQIPDENTLILAKGTEASGLVTFMKSMMTDAKNKMLSIMLIEDKTAPVFSLTDATYADQLKKNFPINVFKDGVWGTYVSTALPFGDLTPVEEMFIGLDFKSDDIMNVEYVQANSAFYKLPNNPWNVTCRVFSASLNLRDLNLYKGKSATAFSLPDLESQRFNLGQEFSGYIKEQKVFGLVEGGALGTSVVADSDLLWNVPTDWSLEEACTVPYSYTLSYYGLNIRGNLRNEDSVLIIGFDSLAIAAVYVALQSNATVFVLLADRQQKLLFRKLFPQIKDSQIIVSMNDNFYLEVMQNTKGKGVQMLFNTMPVQTYQFQSYINSLAENGKCIYLHAQQPNEEILGSSGNIRCVTFHRIMPSCLFKNENVSLRKKINELMNNGLNTKAVHPLPYSTFTEASVFDAFKFLAEERNVCKAVINIREEDNDIQSLEKIFLATKRTYFDSKKSYIVLGSTEEFGIYATSWMVEQGARNLLLITKSTENGDQNLFNFHVNKLRSMTPNVSYLKIDDFSPKNCETIIQKASQMGPVNGVFDFSQFKIPENFAPEQIDENSLKTILSQKVDFLTNMDVVTRKICPSIDYFVSFSSIELDYGVGGLGLHSYANGTIQSLMRNRKNSNLNATLIQWGPVGESPLTVHYNKSQSAASLPPQSMNSCLQTLHGLLQTTCPVVSSFVTCKQSSVISDSKVNVIVEGVAKFLGIKDPSSILPSLTMLELGLDSLIGTDIQQFLEVNYGVSLSTQEVRELTFEKLAQLAETL